MTLKMLYCYYTALVASFLASCSLYKQKNVGPWLKLFCPFLSLTILVEGYGLYLSMNNITNIWVYNIFCAIEYCFYLYVISCIIHNSKMRSITRYAFALYAPIAIIDVLLTPKTSFASLEFSLGSVMIIVCCVYYFFELFRYPKPVNLAREPSFWICLGLLIFYCGNLPYIGLMMFFAAVSQRIINALALLLIIVNIVMYTLFIIAFICRLKIGQRVSASLNS